MVELAVGVVGKGVILRCRGIREISYPHTRPYGNHEKELVMHAKISGAECSRRGNLKGRTHEEWGEGRNEWMELGDTT